MTMLRFHSPAVSRLSLRALALTTIFIAPLAALAQNASLALGQTHRGELAPGDFTLSSGEYVDYLTADIPEGESMQIDLESEAFDTYLIVRTPLGEQLSNDDWANSLEHSRIILDTGEARTVQIGVTSYDVDETGAYALSMSIAGEEDTELPGRVGDGLTRHTPRNKAGLPSITFDVLLRESDTLNVELRATGFVPHLRLAAPDGELWSNAEVVTSSIAVPEIIDVLAETSSSEPNTDATMPHGSSSSLESILPDETTTLSLSVLAPRSGLYTIVVEGSTSDAEGRFTVDAEVIRAPYTGADIVLEETLDEGDERLSRGEYTDVLEVALPAGQHRILAESQDFDTFLYTRLPTGEFLRNDDAQSDSTDAALEITLEQPSVLSIGVTSYRPDSTGAYTLHVFHRDS